MKISILMLALALCGCASGEADWRQHTPEWIENHSTEDMPKGPKPSFWHANQCTPKGDA